MTAQQVSSIQILEKHALKQLRALGYEDGDRVCLRAFLPERGKDGGRKSEFVMPHLSIAELEVWQRERRGIYFVANPGGHKDADISACRAVFYEHDTLGKEISSEMWKHLGLPEPTCQVDTGGKSIHSYWVLEQSIPSEDWRKLQADLLEYADADRALKNPSRVMRLAGCKHAKTGEFARIVGGNGKKHLASELRKIIPEVKQPEVPQQQDKQQTWTEFNKDFSLPITESVPLDICLSHHSRELLQSGAQQERNNNGAKLARDLIGTANHLRAMGQRFDGDPYTLFLDYCQKCPQGDGWNQREWDSIWKPAGRSAPHASLAPDYVENCIKSWAWKYARSEQSTSATRSDAEQVLPTAEEPKSAADLRDVISRYASRSDPFEQELLAAAVRRDFRIGDRALQRLTEHLNPKEEVRLLHVSEIANDSFSELEMRAAGNTLPGLACGFYDLDGMTKGFQRSDLIIVAGRPSSGKTAFSLGLAKNIADLHRLPCLIYSLEMSKIQLFQRLWSTESGVELSRIRTGQVTDGEWSLLSDAISRVSEMPLFINDSGGINLPDIEASARDFVQQQNPLGAIVIDYLQLIDTPGDNRVYEIAKMTRKLKMLARELDIPVIVLSQLSRGVESRTNKRPMMSDLRESGGIENDADLIMMLYREEYYDPDTPDRGIAEVIISKHRNGPTGTIKLLFEPQYTRFRNLAQGGAA